MKHAFVQAAMAAGLLGMLPAAHAIPTLSLSADGGPAITCADGAACDTNPNAGVVGSHTLQIALSDTGFDIYGGRITTDFGGTLSGMGGSLAYGAYYDAGNALFGQGTLIGTGSSGPGAYSGSADGGWSPNAPYSVTEILTLTTGGGLTVFSGDFSVNVPEPGTLALIGLALLGLAVAHRRRVPARGFSFLHIRRTPRR
jgi:hypothetical protein